MICRKRHNKTLDWYQTGTLLYEMVVGIPAYYSKNPSHFVINILKAKLKFPTLLSPEIMDLIIKLLRRKPEERLGFQNDAEDIKNHKFFDGYNWELALQKKLKPPN